MSKAVAVSDLHCKRGGCIEEVDLGMREVLDLIELDEGTDIWIVRSQPC